jgi:bleomycin hydrolase
VGYKEDQDQTWILIKDSGRSAYRGQFKGYYFYRQDYVKLKMLSIMVHRDAVAELLAKFTD